MKPDTHGDMLTLFVAMSWEAQGLQRSHIRKEKKEETHQLLTTLIKLG